MDYTKLAERVLRRHQDNTYGSCICCTKPHTDQEPEDWPCDAYQAAAILEQMGKQEPVALAVQSSEDGSFANRIAPTNWMTFEEEKEKLLNHSWIKANRAKIVSLYAAPVLRAPASRAYLCGCVLCICDDDVRCHGCGAKQCGKGDTECDWRQEQILKLKRQPASKDTIQGEWDKLHPEMIAWQYVAGWRAGEHHHGIGEGK